VCGLGAVALAYNPSDKGDIGRRLTAQSQLRQKQ
jgi:hypothetical protein